VGFSLISSVNIYRQIDIVSSELIKVMISDLAVLNGLASLTYYDQ
jgi:hypothetical protein